MDVENIKNSANGLKQVQAPANADQERKSEQTMGEDIVTQLFQGELISQVVLLHSQIVWIFIDNEWI